MAKTILIATDGSCIQQGGFRKGDETDRPGAAGFVAVMDDGSKCRTAVPYANGTIGTMETTALLMALEFLRPLGLTSEDRVVIKCDSQYVVNGANEWRFGWAAKGWRKKGGLTAAAEWARIHELLVGADARIEIQWVRGHAGEPLNEECDALVNGCARSQVAVETPSIAPIAEKPIHFVRDADLPEDMRADALDRIVDRFVHHAAPEAMPTLRDVVRHQTREARLESLLGECLAVIGNPHMPWDQATRDLAEKVRRAIA